MQSLCQVDIGSVLLIAALFTQTKMCKHLASLTMQAGVVADQGEVQVRQCCGAAHEAATCNTSISYVYYFLSLQLHFWSRFSAGVPGRDTEGGQVLGPCSHVGESPYLLASIYPSPGHRSYEEWASGWKIAISLCGTLSIGDSNFQINQEIKKNKLPLLAIIPKWSAESRSTCFVSKGASDAVPGEGSTCWMKHLGA